MHTVGIAGIFINWHGQVIWSWPLPSSAFYSLTALNLFLPSKKGQSQTCSRGLEEAARPWRQWEAPGTAQIPKTGSIGSSRLMGSVVWTQLKKKKKQNQSDLKTAQDKHRTLLQGRIFFLPSTPRHGQFPLSQVKTPSVPLAVKFGSTDDSL